MSTRYNGWSNYETWNIALWIDNDGYCGGADGVREQAEQIAGQSDDQDDAAQTLARALESQFDEYVAELDLKGPFADIIGAALQQVDWREIAYHYIEADMNPDWAADKVDADA